MEAELTHRGWPLATSPADADLLVVAGSAGPELAAVVERTWAALPAPRARIEISMPSRAVSALDGAAALLRDHAHQRAHPSGPHDLATVKEAEHGGEHGGGEHGGGEHGGGTAAVSTAAVSTAVSTAAVSTAAITITAGGCRCRVACRWPTWGRTGTG